MPEREDPDFECEYGCMPMDHGIGLGPDEKRGIPTEHGTIELIVAGPMPPPQDLTEEEKLEFLNEYLERVPDPWVVGRVYVDPSDKGATGVYNQMVHRNTEGPDPLVPEP